METNIRKDFTAAAVFGALIALGLIVGGWILGTEIKEIKLADRYVSVKGLVERTVKSDLAVWTISFNEIGSDLPGVYAKSEADRQLVMQFLKTQGISAAEIEAGQIHVGDRRDDRDNGGNRFSVEQTITVRSSNVDLIAAAGQKTAELVQQGIVLSGNGSITYKFNGLNSIKPDMITEATKSARAAADRFAADSGSKVGSIRQANQGVFSIEAADAAPAGDDDGGGGGDQSIMKKVRVVATVDYYLQN